MLLAGSNLFPAAPAAAAVIQIRAISNTPLPGTVGLPLWSSPAGLQPLRLDVPALVPGALSALPALAAPGLRLDASLPAPAATRLAPLSAAPRAWSAVAPKAESVRAALVRTGAELRAAQSTGGQDAGRTLATLYGGNAAPQARAIDPVAIPAGPVGAAPSTSRLRAARPGSRGETVFITPRIAKTVVPSGAGFELQVGVADLLREDGAESRTALSRRIAQEALAALAPEETAPEQVAALADFLRDAPEYRPEGATAVHLDLDGRNHFRLQFDLGDGGRRILFGQFLGGAFVLMGPIEVSAEGRVRQEHPGYWREYAGADLRREWSGASRTEERGWGPWARTRELQETALTEQSWGGGNWLTGRTVRVKTLLVKEGRSLLGRIEDRIMRAPVLGAVLRFSEKTAETAFTGVSIARHALVSLLAGPRLRGIDTAADFAKNPLLRRLKGDRWFLERLSPAARETLGAKVRAERRLAIESQPAPVPPELAQGLLDAPVTAREAAAVLRAHFGIGTYGRRLIRAGSESRGWRRAARIAAGVLVAALEGAADSVCNPILWTMLGLGAVQTVLAGASAGTSALEATLTLLTAPFLLSARGRAVLGLLRGALVSTEAAGALAGLYAVRAAHMTVTALWWAPWLFSATDHMGRVVQLTARGEFDKDYFKQLSKAGADAIHYFIIP